jgi:hypothetical protein
MRSATVSGKLPWPKSRNSSALLPGSTPYVRSRVDLDRMLRTIEAYLHFFLDEVGGITMTPAEFRASLMRKSAVAGDSHLELLEFAGRS